MDIRGLKKLAQRFSPARLEYQNAGVAFNACLKTQIAMPDVCWQSKLGTLVGENWVVFEGRVWHGRVAFLEVRVGQVVHKRVHEAHFLLPTCCTGWRGVKSSRQLVGEKKNRSPVILTTYPTQVRIRWAEAECMSGFIRNRNCDADIGCAREQHLYQQWTLLLLPFKLDQQQQQLFR